MLGLGVWVRCGISVYESFESLETERSGLVQLPKSSNGYLEVMLFLWWWV